MSSEAVTVSCDASRYDAIVIGSGYGGGVAASRLARMGLRVGVFEQGRRWRPGEFPITASAKRKSTRLTGRAPKIGDPAGLYYLSVGNGVTVFGASGLGGGSLINAGVVLRPDFGWLRRSGWPADVVDDGLLSEGLARAEKMLGVAAVPDPDRFAKLSWMIRAGEVCGRATLLPAMTISHQPGVNSAGVLQYACRYCGDCWSGCNVGAKNTVAITYLADATDHGAAVYCESRARSVARTGSGWQVEVDDLSGAKLTRYVEAPIVVLAAGTLGTTELLLRAQKNGLPLSSKLGEKFSANGDDLVIASGLDAPVHAVATGYPPQAPRWLPPVGPHSGAVIDLGDADGPLWVHDGTMLRIMAALAPLKNILQLRWRLALRQLRYGAYDGDLRHTQLLYIVSHDDASGRLQLVNDRIAVDWPGYSDLTQRVRAEQKTRDMIEKMGGVFGENPFAMPAFGGNRIIAHPLGGATMATSADKGVVSPDGRVFDPSKGPQGIHEGLYVCDGAAISSAVGVSPLLTITALAERAMILAARRLGRVLDVGTSPARPSRDALM